MDDFEFDNDESVRERVIEYLKHLEDTARPGEIAEAVGASQSYIYKVLSDLHNDGLAEKHFGQHVVGHPMPDGGSVVLPSDKDALLDIVEQYRPSLLSDAKDLPVPNLRTLIESEIAVGDPHPMGNRKVSYSYAGD